MPETFARSACVRLSSSPRLLLVVGLTAFHAGSVERPPDQPSPVATLSSAAAPIASVTGLLPRYQGALSSSRPATGGKDPKDIHEFYFTRVIYSGFRRQWWRVDYPKADRQFLIGLLRLTNIDAYQWENPVRLDDPDLRRFPFIYALEVGAMALTPPEVEGLRSYLLAGGFLFVDDFWGDWEWLNFEQEITRVLPEYHIREMSLDHPAFSAFYDIDEIIQVPNVGNGVNGFPTHEKGGIVPHVRGIFDENERLMVVINWNTDLGDAWEWADHPYYPLRFSNFAWQMGINFIIYAMTH